jgi:hypothetical protein
VRHVRILGVCLVAVFAMSAVAAGPALAEEIKPKDFRMFSNCPIYSTQNPNPEGTQACIYGKSNNTSFFKAGNAIDIVHMIHPVTLQGGIFETEVGGEVSLVFELPEGGTSILSKVAEPAPSLTEININIALLSPAELARYEKAVAAGRTKVTATIETAAPFNGAGILKEGNLLEETGTALKFVVVVKLTNPFLGKNCYIGSNSNPITVELTSGPSGTLHGHKGELHFTNEGSKLQITGSSLVDGTFTVPAATGCGEFGGANAAVNAALELPSASGHNETAINGELDQASAEVLRKLHEH